MVGTPQPEHRSRVLILDDDEGQLESLSATLQHEGFDVVGCQSTLAAIQRIGSRERSRGVHSNGCIPRTRFPAISPGSAR